jgi:hypothetical protein
VNASNTESNWSSAMADAGVAHLETQLHRVLGLAEDADVEDDAAALGELDRVVEQVDEHLAQADRIAFDAIRTRATRSCS